MTHKLLIAFLILPLLAAAQGREQSASGSAPGAANEELPRVLYIVPWQDTGQVSGSGHDWRRNIGMMRGPIEREALLRELDLRRAFGQIE